ncbi:alpha/beta hydrolase family protein [Amycolatopsis anabasis]|uniref:alpha/beta hydrolase family protein n=1 Tax=Amycolatopsis anabasis TaxID=1840409 RepID=UPI00131EAD3D|nr:prolyl oligopeptidase family serine peptidase [Amycolatopsis anabasis]
MESQEDTAKPRRRRRILVGTLVVVVLLLAGGTFGIGWYYSGELLNPVTSAQGRFQDTVLESAGGSVTLADSASAARPGEYVLTWEGGGLAGVGPVLDRADGRVRRAVTSGAAPPAGTKVSVANWSRLSDPRSADGLEFAEVGVPTELGPAPAWYVPGSSKTWVIAVHGRGSQPGSRAEALRVLPVLHQLGLPVLDITYRNDFGAPPSPDGLYHLGDTEWRDVEAAMRYARDQGAERFVLYGWSMGGAIVAQTLARSSLAGSVTATVLDAPALDWTAAVAQGAQVRGVPGFLTPLASLFADWRADVDFDRLKVVDNPPAAKPPTLLFHGAEDSTVPVRTSRDLAAAAPRLGWPVRYEEFPLAEHTGEWNTDRPRYESTLRTFLTQ